MCGIIGYTGKNSRAARVVFDGLKRLEYRGYDSAGISSISNGKLQVLKLAGYLSNLEERFSFEDDFSTTAIGHTRWATHGAPSDINAHPHLSCDGRISIVHNGIIENYAELKAYLAKKGHNFISQTDSEVIVHLVEDIYNSQSRRNPIRALRDAVRKLKGSYAIAVIFADAPHKIFAARCNSPLVLSKNENAVFLASDIPALINLTSSFIIMDENEIAELDGNANSLQIMNLKLEPVRKKTQQIDWDITEAEKAGYAHYMLKEIFEQPSALSNCIKSKVTGSGKLSSGENFNLTDGYLKGIKRIHIVACGTAWHAGLTAKYAFEELCALPTTVDMASEFRYANIPLSKNVLVIAVSQSGETADTLAAVKKALHYKCKVLAVTNIVNSSLARTSDSNIYTIAGPEIGVAATKSYSTQIASLYIFALYLASIRKSLSVPVIKKHTAQILAVPDYVKRALDNSASIKHCADKYSHLNNFLFIARKYNFPNALEGALKLKEISYSHAEGYAAGEMKHGPLALIDDSFATVASAANDSVYEKMVSNIQEIKARGGHVIALATEGNKTISQIADDVIYCPKTTELISPLVTIIPMQLLAYYIAVNKGRNVDKPRNLAKSVTVE